MRIDRRSFIKRVAAGTAIASAATVGYWRFELHNIEVTEHDLPIAALPSALEGARLVQVSDLHVGPAVDDDYVRHALERVGALKPDILVMTGDYVTWRGDHQLTQLAGVLEALPKAQLATVAILGNHDYGSGWREGNVADAVASLLTQRGAHVIRNDVHNVEGLAIIGIDDIWARKADVAHARSLVKDDAPSLVLCHNPDGVDLPEWSGYRGWILSGHTHGGQCKPPFLPPPILPVRNKRYAAGKVALEDGRTVYINRAIGHTLPIRVNVRPEIAQFTLRRA